MFRKPKRNIRQRQVVNSDDEDIEANKEYHEVNRKASDIRSSAGESNAILSDDDALSLKELQSNITKFKEGKTLKSKKDKVIKVVDKESKSAPKLSTGNILSFEQELEG